MTTTEPMDNVITGRCFGCGGQSLQRSRSLSRFRSLVNMSPSRFSHVFCLGLLETFASYSSAAEDFPTRIQLSELTETDIVPKEKCLYRFVERTLADEKSEPWPLPSILGNSEFNDLMLKELLGEDSPAVVEKRAASIQTPGSVGAMRIAAEFLQRCCEMKTFFIPESTSFTYEAIFTRAGFQHAHIYRYYDATTHELNFDLMKADIEDAVEKSVVVVQLSAPYPYGINLSDEQWVEFTEIAIEKKLFILFDATGIGLASGKLEKDSWPLRFFTEQGLEFFCVCSFSRILGVWNERIGNLLLVIKDSEILQQVLCHIAVIIKSLFSIPPAHGARVMATILKNPELRQDMNRCIKDKVNELNEKRRLLYWKLKELGTPGKWEFIVKQDGLYIYLGFTEPQIECMRRVHHFTLKQFGGVDLATLNSETICALAKAINSTVKKITTKKS